MTVELMLQGAGHMQRQIDQDDPDQDVDVNMRGGGEPRRLTPGR